MSDHSVPDVVFVVSKKRRTESKSASSTAQLATRGGNSFVDGRPLLACRTSYFFRLSWVGTSRFETGGPMDASLLDGGGCLNPFLLKNDG